MAMGEVYRPAVVARMRRESLRRAARPAARRARWYRCFAPRRGGSPRDPRSSCGGRGNGAIQLRGRAYRGRDSNRERGGALWDDFVTCNLRVHRRCGKCGELLLLEASRHSARNRVPWFDPKMCVIPVKGPERRSQRAQSVAERSHRTQTIPRRSTHWQR
jgi:hypothetical protein